MARRKEGSRDSLIPDHLVDQSITPKVRNWRRIAKTWFGRSEDSDLSQNSSGKLKNDENDQTWWDQHDDDENVYPPRPGRSTRNEYFEEYADVTEIVDEDPEEDEVEERYGVEITDFIDWDLFLSFEYNITSAFAADRKGITFKGHNADDYPQRRQILDAFEALVNTPIIGYSDSEIIGHISDQLRMLDDLNSVKIGRISIPVGDKVYRMREIIRRDRQDNYYSGSSTPISAATRLREVVPIIEGIKATIRKDV